MGILQIRKAQREGAKMLIGFAGVSGSGKTYTALQFAYGLANYDSSKIGLLDTENRRGSLYSDIIKDQSGIVQPFLIGDLYPPFSPARYIEAIKEFQAAGVQVLIIDSVTHEWEGEGGASEIAEKNLLGRQPNWSLAKMHHKKFVNQLLLSDMHVIVCVRAREKTKPMKNSQGKTEFVDCGLQAIQEKNFMFEMTASLMMENEGRTPNVIKCPSDLQQYLGRGNGYITPEDGKAVRDWVDGAKQLDPKTEAYRNKLQAITGQGLEHIKDCWRKTPLSIQESLGEEFKNQIFASAKAYDEQEAQEQKSKKSQTN